VTQTPINTETSTSSTAADVARTGQEEAKHVVEKGKEQAGELAGQAKEQALDLYGDARRELRSQAESQATRLAETVRSMSRQLSAMAQHAPEDGTVKSLTEQAASRTDQLAARLETTGLDGAVDEVKRFARERPLVFLGGALGLGLIVGRVVRNTNTKELLQAAKPDGSGNGQGSGDVSPHSTTGSQPGAGLTTPSGVASASASPITPPQAGAATAPEVTRG
jgi:hypothetical protein